MMAACAVSVSLSLSSCNFKLHSIISLNKINSAQPNLIMGRKKDDLAK